MARCWTCGSEIPSGLRYLFTCPTCEGVQEIKSFRKGTLDNLDELVRVQRHGFEILSDRLSEVAAVIEWGFGEIGWQLQQQTDVLRSIDHTLKTPGETKANEWRLHAEELRRRGVLEESEEFFLKALNEYRLDYRIYVGLAETYLRMNKFDKAKFFLEKSLPHAPKEIQEPTIEHKRLLDLTRNFLRESRIKKTDAINEYQSKTGAGLAEAQDIVDQIANQGGKAELGLTFDWKSHSYRLIGHIYACDEDYTQAATVLQSSIELSPGYGEGHYDYAQYCSQIGKKKDCLDSLRMAILLQPLFWYLTQKEQNFDPLRSEVEKLLSKFSTEASCRAKGAIAKAESIIKQAGQTVSKARQSLTWYKKNIKGAENRELKSSPMYEDAEAKLKLAKDHKALEDYMAFLDAESIAEESYILAINALDTANEELEFYEGERREHRAIFRRLISWPLITGAIGTVVGAITGLGVVVGAFCGLFIGLFAWGIWSAVKYS